MASMATSRPAHVDAVSTQRDPADSLYKAANTTLSDNDYRRAAAAFKQVVDKYPKSLHASDAVGALRRILEMGVDPAGLAATAVLVVGQRLVRRTCVACAAQTCERAEQTKGQHDRCCP